MVANSWLYHYYTVQSKLQFGLPFEGSTRVPPTTPGAAAAAAAAYYHHHHHNHHHHHHSPTGVGTTTAYAMAMHNPHHSHQYHHHHMATYGTLYHSSSVEEPNQQNNGNSHNGTGNGHALSAYSQRLGLEPVDYSPLSNAGSPPTSRSGLLVSEMRCSSANSSLSSQNTISSNYPTQNQKIKAQNLSSPPAKRRALGNVETLYMPEEDSLPAEDCTSRSDSILSTSNHYQNTPTLTNGGGSAEAHGSVVFATVVPTRPRFLAKPPPQEPPDFMDQWNPSPPWSDTTQKTSSIDSSSSASHQELSPCITTTPPTPTSAPPNGLSNSVHGGCSVYGVGSCNNQTIPPAFTFEWMSDQLVPPTPSDSVIPCLTSDGVTLMVAHAHHNHSHWTTGVSSENAHQQLSQHLAARGHPIFGLPNSGSQASHEPTQISHDLELSRINNLHAIKLITKTEVVEEIDEKPKI